MSVAGKLLAAMGVLVVAGSATGFSLAAASNGNGNGNGGAAGAPPQPVIGSSNLPTNPTNVQSATFTYTDSRASVTFYCSLDGAAFASCSSAGVSYGNLGNATHTFRVEAQSGAGNAPMSTPASYSWTVANEQFPISGSLTTPLAPGLPAEPLDIQVSNPYSFNIKVTSLSVSIASTNKTGCSPTANFAVQQYTGPSFVVNSGANETLLQAGVAQSTFPEIRMLDLTTNQDACKGAILQFSYTGSATTP